MTSFIKPVEYKDGPDTIVNTLGNIGAHYFALSRLVGKPDWKRSLGSLRRGSEVGIGMELELFVGVCTGTSWLRIWFTG